MQNLEKLNKRVSKIESNIAIIGEYLEGKVASAIADLYNLTEKFNELNKKIDNLSRDGSVVDNTTSLELLKQIKDKHSFK